MNDSSAYMIPMPTGCDYESSCEFRDNTDKRTAPEHIAPQIRPYMKRWSASIYKAAPAKKAPAFTSRNHIRMKIETGEKKIASGFAKESHLLCKEFTELKTLSLSEKALQTGLRRLSEQHIDSLWMNCAKNYASVCALSCLDSFFSSAVGCGTDDLDADKLCTGLAGLLETFQNEAVEYYEEQKERFKSRLDNVIENSTDSWDGFMDDVSGAFSQSKVKFGDEVHRLRIKAKLGGIRLSGRDMYTYVCNNSETTCDICAALDGKHFSIDEAEEGVNLPPMHPNCRCTIEAYPPLPEDFDIEDIIDPDMLKDELDNMLGKLESIIDNAADSVSSFWKYIFSSNLREYYGTYTTVKIGGKEYHINRSTFFAVAIGPDGKLIEPDNAKPYDEKMLELMRRRDELPEGNEERREIEAEIEHIKNISDEETLSVMPNNPYSFYVLGGDITEQLDDYMRQTEIDYVYMHERYWADNLLEFKSIVDDFSTMDLKRLPEWQHSAFIYDGEIVDQDVPGNINYGYFGTFCNMPDAVLLAGAGQLPGDAGDQALQPVALAVVQLVVIPVVADFFRVVPVRGIVVDVI